MIDIFDCNLNNRNNLNKNKNDLANSIITSLMKIIMILLEEKHPSIILKSIDIIKELFEYIRKNDIKLNIDLNLTDSVLVKIKRKLGDVNRKVRNKIIAFYCYMLTLDFCDYNNLISELIEGELNCIDLKYIPKSQNLILSKLEIFNDVFQNFNEALKSKRTSLETFPSNLIVNYLILNVNSHKSEVRKLCRLNISKYISIFGVSKIKKKLEKIENRELLKLINEIPLLETFFPKIHKNNINTYSLSLINTSNSSSNDSKKKKNNIKIHKIGEKPKGRNSQIKIANKNYILYNYDKENNKINENNSNEKYKIIKKKLNDFCDFCKRKMKKDENISKHWNTNCSMFVKCEKCNINIEVKFLMLHKLSECKFKKDFKKCRTCHEVLSKEEYEIHLRNKCGIKHGYIKCPLCHEEIHDNNKAYYQHLVKDGCPANKRINK